MNDSISGFVGEFFGSFLLTFVIGINAAVNGNDDPAIPIGFFLAALVFSGGINVNVRHFNAALSFDNR